MDRLLDRIAERRAGLAEQAQRLRKELTEVEAELERVASAEQVVAQLLAETDADAEGGAGDQDGADRGQGGEERPGRPPRAALTVPHCTDGADAQDLPADYRRLVQIVAEEGPVGQGVACKRVTAKLGLSGEARHTEGVRVKLKRLVARGWLVEVAPGRFASRP